MKQRLVLISAALTNCNLLYVMGTVARARGEVRLTWGFTLMSAPGAPPTSVMPQVIPTSGLIGDGDAPGEAPPGEAPGETL